MELRELTAILGVSGDEGAVRSFILRQADACAAQTRVDRIGNVLAFKKGTAPDARHAMLCAHMDEVGLIVTAIEEDGLLDYDPVGGIDARVLVSKRVFVGKNRVPGVIGAKAIHLQSAEDREKPLDHTQLYIDIGCKDKESTQKLVSLGDYAAFDPEYEEFGAGLVVSKALDDRIGCYNLLRLMQEDFPCDVTYAFHVQEETGLRGAQVSAFQTVCDCALVLEGTTANDLGDIEAHLRVCEVGRGVAISFMDNTSIAHPGLNRALRDLAESRSIPWQIKQFVSGGNDAGAIQTARGALPVCPVSVPCRYIHSPSSVCSISDIESQYQLARAFLESNAAFEREDKTL